MESSFFPYIGAFCWVGILLMVGTFLRAKVKFLQTLLFPASLIGGIIGFALINLGMVGMPSSSGWKVLTPKVFSLLTFHLFAFGFVGIGLLDNKNSKQADTGREVTRGALWIALLFGFLFSVQALTGKGVFELWHLMFGGDFYVNNGYLLGAGFTQGPGQTQAYATIWEQTYHVANSINVGLAFASVGFLVAGLVGVPLAYYGIRRGWVKVEGHTGTLPESFRKGLMDKDAQPPCACATTHPANIDSLGFHLGLMFAIYGAAYCFGVAWFVYLPRSIAGLGIGLIFCWGMFIAMLTRKMMRFLHIEHLIDSESVRRLTGVTVDFMICAVFMGIHVAALREVAIPFAIAVILGSALTLVVCVWFGRRAPSYGFERGLTLFGYCTGTAASGLLLLRVVDPDFETPVAIEVGLMNVFAVVLFKPISLSMPFVPVEGFPMALIFAGVIVATPIAMYILKLIRKPAF